MNTAEDFTKRRRAKLITEYARIVAASPPDFVKLADVVAEIARIDAPTASPLASVGAVWGPLPPETLVSPPPARRWLLCHPGGMGGMGGDGLLPLGKAGVLAGEGGVSKTTSIISLGVSVLTGRPWFGHFEIPLEARRGRVLLALAEEDAEEVHRRLWDVAEALGLDSAERDRVQRDLVVLPLAGRPVSLLEVSPDRRSYAESDELRTLRERLRGEGPWSLVALDPLARWAGPDTEGDNAAATRIVQAVESLTEVPGTPTVLTAHHSSKEARRSGKADARGVTGLTDGMRWAATLRADGEAVCFQQTKSNYSRPMPDELRLVRGPRGVLRVPTDVEDRERAGREAAAVDDQLTDQVHRVVMALRAEGELTSIDAIAARAGMNLGKGRAAVRLAMARSLIVKVGTSKAPRYRADVPSEGGEKTPHTPLDVGRPEGRPPWTSRTSSDVVGRPDVEASSQNGRASW